VGCPCGIYFASVPPNHSLLYFKADPLSFLAPPYLLFDEARGKEFPPFLGDNSRAIDVAVDFSFIRWPLLSLRPHTFAMALSSCSRVVNLCPFLLPFDGFPENGKTPQVLWLTFTVNSRIQDKFPGKEAKDDARTKSGKSDRDHSSISQKL
jgi:hypothetical protein